MQKRENVIAIIPAYNEQGKIGNVVQKVTAQSTWVDVICVVDDCSADQTSAEAAAAGAVVIRHEKNQGVGAAIRTGIEYGRQQHFTIGVVLSGDDQHHPDELPRVLHPILNEGFDFVQGSRYMAGGAVINQGLFRKITTLGYRVLFFLFTGKSCSDVTNGFRAFKIEQIAQDPIINLHQDWLNRYELEVYLLYQIYTSQHYKRKEVPITITYHPKSVGNTKMTPFVDWWRILRPLIFLKLGLRT